MALTSNFGYNIGDVLKEYLDDPIFILNKDYEFEYCSNNRHLKNLGLISLEGKITDILHPHDFQRGVDFLQNVSKVEQAIETLRVRYGDKFRFYEFKGRVFKNEVQEIKYLITIRDITQFKKKEEDWVKKEKKLRKLAETMQEIRFWKLLQTKDEKSSFQNSREMLDLVIDNIPQFIYWKNKQMVYLGCNQNFALINNLDDPNFIVGKTDIELPWSRANIKRIYERERTLMQNNQSESIIEAWILPDGNEAWFDINRIPLLNINNDIVGILCTYNNITSRVEAERKSIDFEKKYRQIIDDIKEAYFEVDLKGNFTFSNKSFSQMIGYSFDEMIGKNYKQLLNDENQMKVFEKFNSVYNSGLPQEYFQFEFIKKGNTKVIVETSVYLNKNTSGKKIGFYGISRDITQKFNLELKFKQSEEKYRHLFESSPYAIWIVDLNGELIDCNRTTNIMLSKYTREDIIGKNFVEVLGMFHRPEYFIPFFKSKFDSFVQDKPMKALEFKITRLDGIEKWIKIRSSKIKLGNETLIQILIQDITGKKKADLKLQRSEEELKILNKELEKKVQERTKELRDSEEKFRTIAENSLMGVGILQDNKVQYINQQFAALAGYNIDEVKEFNLMDIFQSIHPDDRKLVMEQLKKKQEGLKDYVAHYQYRIFDKTGGVKWVDNYSKTINFMGSPADLISGIDITDRKKAEEELKESEEKYRHLYENSPFSIVLLNYEGKIIDMNLKTTEIFGYKKEDLINKNYLNLIDIFPKETKLELRMINDLMSKGEPSNPIMKPQITKIYTKAKKPVWVESELSTVRIGGELMILTIIQDITEKKLAEEKLKESERRLRQQNIELKELDRLKTDFISIAAHDLKTPLISVGGYIDLILLREKGLNEEVKEDLNRVLNNVQRLDGYINRLLDVMKIEAKKVELVKKEENIHDIIKNCISELEFQIRQKKLTINLDISEILKLRVDHFRISQTFLNLLSNAVKFTPKNGKIDISIVEEHESILFKITDNGKGLTPEEIQKIFGKFVTIEQGIDGHSTLNKGTGLGLYIAKGFIEAHGGKIWVESKGRDMGAEFSFILPK